MTRLWASGLRIRVRCDAQGIPVAFVWEQRQHTVSSIANRWRVQLRWWRAGEQRIWRDYYKLVTAGGLLVVLYQDRLSGGWYLQRVYD